MLLKAPEARKSVAQRGALGLRGKPESAPAGRKTERDRSFVPVGALATGLDNTQRLRAGLHSFAPPALSNSPSRARFGQHPPCCRPKLFSRASGANQSSNRYAMSASEIGKPEPIAVPPEAAMTTYCLPSLPM